MAMNPDPFNLQRFVDAQADVHEEVLAELAQGRKATHWMWFVFPQLRALGRSVTAHFYGIASPEQARAYPRHPVLGPRLRQCVDNVLSNAIAHSPGNAPVSVFVSEVVHDGMPWGQMEIVDEGPGIPDAALPCLFDRFYTGRGSSGGIGLGLYIAKRIAIAHGGDLIADRYPGKGARFTIRLPAMVLPVVSSSRYTPVSTNRIRLPRTVVPLAPKSTSTP